MKSIELDGNVIQNGNKGIVVLAKELNSAEDWVVRLSNKGNAVFHGVPRDARVKITVVVAEMRPE